MNVLCRMYSHMDRRRLEQNETCALNKFPQTLLRGTSQGCWANLIKKVFERKLRGCSDFPWRGWFCFNVVTSIKWNSKCLTRCGLLRLIKNSESVAEHM